MSNEDATQVVSTEPKFLLVDEQGVATHVQGEMIVGRSDECDLVVDDPKASRKHAKIRIEGATLVVEDLGSTNGTHHEGVRKPAFNCLDGESLSFPNARFRLKVEQPFSAASFDPDKTMPVDLSELRGAAAASVPSEKPIQAPESDAVAETASAKDRQPEQPKSELGHKVDQSEDDNTGGDGTSGAWWESGEHKSDGTAVFKLDELGGGKTNVAALVQLGPALEPRIVVKSGVEAGNEFKLHKGSFVLGKDASCDIRLSEETVSDQHAKLIHDGHTWQLVNLLALNHTYVNDEKIQSVYLNSGDQIRLGGTMLVFQLPDIGAKSEGSSKKTVLWYGVGALSVALAGGLYLLWKASV